jgi:hypothetical protein
VTAVLPAAQQAQVEPARRAIFRYASYLAGGLPLLAAAYGATAGRLRHRVVSVDVPLAHLPPSLDGVRIVPLGDLYSGDFMPRAAIRRAVDLANSAKPDLAVLTGDLITSARDPLEDGAAELGRLQAPRKGVIHTAARLRPSDEGLPCTSAAGVTTWRVRAPAGRGS